mmetsp:Transcript_34227/g.96188  ORF Transcript_34227/g.96188 Transcript_34227/m.96188 type:complete len:219 (-) Transcript_34227:764-1420(-)
MSHWFGALRSAMPLRGFCCLSLSIDVLRLTEPEAALRSRRSRHATSKKMAQSVMRSDEAMCGRGLVRLKMTLFWMAVARQRMTWSTSKPARHSLICALSRDFANFVRCAAVGCAGSSRPLLLGSRMGLASRVTSLASTCEAVPPWGESTGLGSGGPSGSAASPMGEAMGDTFVKSCTTMGRGFLLSWAWSSLPLADASGAASGRSSRTPSPQSLNESL